MATVETYTTADRAFTYDLCKSVNGRWTVVCWKHVSGAEGDEELEYHWESAGVVTQDDGLRQKRTPHTEETARAEFERWRS